MAPTAASMAGQARELRRVMKADWVQVLRAAETAELARALREVRCEEEEPPAALREARCEERALQAPHAEVPLAARRGVHLARVAPLALRPFPRRCFRRPHSAPIDHFPHRRPRVRRVRHHLVGQVPHRSRRARLPLIPPPS